MDYKDIYERSKSILLSVPMSKNNEKRLIAFLRDLRNSDIKYASQINYVDSLTFFFRILAKNNKEICDIKNFDRECVSIFLDELNEHTYISKTGKIKSYSQASKQKHRLIVKVFLKKMGRHDLAEMIEVKRMNNSKLPEDLLTPEEVDKIIEAAEHPRDKAFISMLYESGARAGEMVACNLNSLAFDENGCVITIPAGKTGARRIRVVNCASYLRVWIENHPQKDADPGETPLWPTIRKPHRRIETEAISPILRFAAEKAGVKKKVNPHAFRHARATKLAGHLTEQQMKNYLGWTANSAMAAIYVHLSGKDMDDAILKMNGLKAEEETHEILTPGKCPRCKQMNHHSAPLCFMCGFPLKKDAERSVEKTASKLLSTMLRLAKSDPELEAMLNDALNELE